MLFKIFKSVLKNRRYAESWLMHIFQPAISSSRNIASVHHIDLACRFFVDARAHWAAAWSWGRIPRLPGTPAISALEISSLHVWSSPEIQLRSRLGNELLFLARRLCRFYPFWYPVSHAILSVIRSQFWWQWPHFSLHTNYPATKLPSPPITFFWCRMPHVHVDPTFI